ncbi:MAG: hypothetical protein IJ504_07380 [Bacteroidales bacterium]|nr:hypothetical protein [Bacteroidales bacterium]
MLRLIILLSTAVLMAGCSDAVRPGPGESSFSFRSCFADRALADSIGMDFRKGDKIAVSGAVSPFTVSSVSDGVAVLEGYAKPSDAYHAVYPYQAFKEFRENEESHSQAVMELPLVQTARPGTIPDGTALAVGRTDASGREFRLNPLMTYLKFTISPQAGKIRTISVIHEDGNRLSGEFSVDCASEYVEVFPTPNSASNVVLRPESQFFEPGEYYVAAFPDAYNGPLTFAFENEEGRFAVEKITFRNNLYDTHIVDAGTFRRLKYEMEPVYLSVYFQEFTSAGGTFSLEFMGNRECTVTVGKGKEWIDIVRTKDVHHNVCTYHVSENASETRTGEIIVQTTDGSCRLVHTIMQGSAQDVSDDKLRSALIDLYNATDGDNWKNNENWCSDKPLSEWYGVRMNAYYGTRYDIFLNNNNLSGVLPSSMRDLRGVWTLSMNGNHLSGEIPSGIFTVIYANLQDNSFTSLAEPDDDGESILQYLHLSDNEMSGPLPEFLADHRFISLDLSENDFTGSLPASYTRLLNRRLSDLRLDGNRLSGTIPDEITQNPYFNDFWTTVLNQRGEGFDMDGLELYAPELNMSLYRGEVSSLYNTGDIFRANEYTLLYRMDSDTVLDVVKRWYDAYKDRGFEVIALWTGTPQAYPSYGYEWLRMNGSGFGSYDMWYAPTPSLGLVDKEGRIVVNPFDWSSREIEELLVERCGELPIPTDDGKVTVLQSAKEGKGINLVLLGDAYDKRDVDYGIYAGAMKQAMEAFFSKEPFRSYRHLFNVYCVNVISDVSGYGSEVSSALKCSYGAGTSISGDDELCMAYAAKAVSENDLDETTVIVVMNSDKFGGSTYMYSPAGGDHGSGMSISYIPKVKDHDGFEGVLVHEAGGHGFAKLADEYFSTSGDAVTDDVRRRVQEREDAGWYRNCDFTNDPESVKWAHFLEDKRYSKENLGIYEGALSFSKDVYRPSYTSMMRSNLGSFNAPSREAIWYRMHRLAYGDTWQYDFEDFAAYDISTNL